MRLSVFLIAVIAGQSAHADPGHLIGVAGGHDHWLAAGAIGAAIAAGIWGALKGKREKDEAEPEPEPEEAQEA